MSLKYLLSSNDTDLVNTGMVTKFKPYDSTKKNKILGFNAHRFLYWLSLHCGWRYVMNFGCSSMRAHTHMCVYVCVVRGGEGCGPQVVRN